MKVKILYAKGWNNKTKKYYNLYIYAEVNLKTKQGKKISKKNYDRNQIKASK